MKVYILVAVLMLGGCSDAPSGKQFERASKWCKDFGGVKKVTYSKVNGLKARCNDKKLIIHAGF